LTAAPVCVRQRVRPVRASMAQTSPFQSPTTTSPLATSGDDSVGPSSRRQRSRPVTASNASSSPPGRREWHSGLPMNVT
jgi:hypothetical protein